MATWVETDQKVSKHLSQMRWVYQYFFQKCHKILTSFCAIFPSAGVNLHQSTENEGTVKSPWVKTHQWTCRGFFGVVTDEQQKLVNKEGRRVIFIWVEENQGRCFANKRAFKTSMNQQISKLSNLNIVDVVNIHSFTTQWQCACFINNDTNLFVF